MTLDKTWEECLQMWKWMVANLDKKRDIFNLKRTWLLKEGYAAHDYGERPSSGKSVANGCFLCDYQETHPKMKSVTNASCSRCPAARIDPSFDCDDTGYSWHINPKAFYKKLLELNKKRLAK